MSRKTIAPNRAAARFARGATGVLILASVVGGAVGHWVTEGFDRVAELFDTAYPPLAVFATVALVLLAFCVLCSQYDRINQQISASARIVDIDSVQDRRFLICGVSPFSCARHQTIPKPEDLEQNPDAIARASEHKLCNWQQPVRVIHALKGVQRIYIIQPNHDHTEAFREILLHVFADRFTPDDIILIKGHETRDAAPCPDGKREVQFSTGRWKANYENYTYITAAIDWALADVCKQASTPSRRRALHRQVAIDVTSGNKVLSIAAAVASFNRDAVFVYACNEPQAHADGRGVIVFDASIELFGDGMRLG